MSTVEISTRIKVFNLSERFQHREFSTLSTEFSTENAVISRFSGSFFQILRPFRKLFNKLLKNAVENKKIC